MEEYTKVPFNTALLSAKSYTVGWICALPLEMAAAQAVLDEIHDSIPVPAYDNNIYVLGMIHGHNVVIACLPTGSYGATSATTVATQMLYTFPHIRFGLMVGIGGGVPTKVDIRLGDVVVSKPTEHSGGVIQFDLALLTALSKLQADHMSTASRIPIVLTEMLDRHPTMKPGFDFPGSIHDQLFDADYNHSQGACSCDYCDLSRLKPRLPRETTDPVIHYGKIGSGNQVMRDASTRDDLAKEHEILCFEMEAAGLMDNFPCLVIRGICDYADSHKNKIWQGYAAATAAAYAKELLSKTPVREVGRYLPISTLQHLYEQTNKVNGDDFLQKLKVARQEAYVRHVPPLEEIQSQFFWVLNNLDFQSWRTENHYTLWLSHELWFKIRPFSSYVVSLAQQNCKSDHQHIVLYFFCSAADSKQPTMPVFIRTIIHQFLSQVPRNTQSSIIKELFIRLLKGAQVWDTWQSLESKSLPTADEIILRAPVKDLWPVLLWLLTASDHKISLVLDGLNEVEGDLEDFIIKVRELVEFVQKRITRLKALVTSRPIPEIRSIFQGFPHIEYNQEREEFLQILKFHNTRYEMISEEFKGSFTWLWSHDQYREWAASTTSRLLYIQGKPGSGKSTLTKYFTDKYKEHLGNNQAIVTTFFYSYRDGELQRSHFSMLRSILFDILDQSESFFYQVQTLYRKYRDILTATEHHQYHASKLYTMFKSILLALADHPPADHLVIIIDAMDESDNEVRRDIIELLLELCSKSTRCIVKVFIASRPVVELESRRARQPDHNFIQLQEHTRQDISEYAQALLGRLTMSMLLHRVIEYIVCHAQGVFLWVKLVCEELQDYIEGGNSEDDVMNFLESLPKDLEIFYLRIFTRLEDNNHTDRRDGIKMFQFVLFGFRPLTLEEIQHTLGIPDKQGINEPIPSEKRFLQRLPNISEEVHGLTAMERRIIRCGGNFIEIRGQRGSRSVQIMHQTVREFFLQPDGHVARSNPHLNADLAHISISITCLRYLIFFISNMPVPGASISQVTDVEVWVASGYFDSCAKYLDSKPLMSYTLSYLLRHISCCAVENISPEYLRMRNLLFRNRQALRLLRSWYERTFSSDLELPRIDTVENVNPLGNSILHCAAQLNLPQAVNILEIAGVGIDITDSQGQTALHIAVINGSRDVVEQLIQLHVDIEAPTRQGNTPLELAVANGRADIASVLLHYGAAVRPLRDGETLLHSAARHGNHEVSSLLLDMGFNIDEKNRFGNTPLHLAVLYGRVAIVKLLLDRGADCRARDRDTLLRMAAEKGHESVVALLLQMGFNVNQRTSGSTWLGETPLRRAAGEGSSNVVKFLVTQNAKVNAIDRWGQTPLHWATADGHLDVVRLLIQQHSNVNVKGMGQQLPLHLAVNNACMMEEDGMLIIDALLKAGANPNEKDESGWTPLHIVMKNMGTWLENCQKIATFLLRYKADVNSQDNQGKTPLHLAIENTGAWSQHSYHIIPLLIDSGADIHIQDKDGKSPLDYAEDRDYGPQISSLSEKATPWLTKSTSHCTMM